MQEYKNMLSKLKKYKKGIYWGIIALFVLYIITDLTVSNIKEKPEKVPYKQFEADLADGKIDCVYYTSTSDSMRYTLLNDETKDMKYEDRLEYTYEELSDWRITTYPNYEEFRKDCLEAGVRTVTKSFSPKALNLIALCSTLIIPMFFIVLLISTVRGMKKMGISGNDEVGLVEKSDVTFADVIGLDEILDDVKFIVELIKNPEMGKEVGTRLPKGVLLSGDPGVGKTLIAKAIAGEAGVPFIYLNASSFVEMFVGLGAKRVRSAFEVAKKNSPCIVFIDEIDAVGGKRGGMYNGESDQTLNALLQEMDGFDTGTGIFVIGATNLPEKLDRALTRSGRFDRKLEINPPRDWRIRKQLFEHYLGEKPVDETVDLEVLSRQTAGFTGADISAIVNEACIISAMHDGKSLSGEDMENAIDKHVFKGNKVKNRNEDVERKVVAYHEAGHAVASHLLGIAVARASIAGTTNGVGGAVFQQESDTRLLTNEDFRKKIMVSYGGRASEEIKFGKVSTGASNDITQATNYIESYVHRYGFDKDFGLLDISILRDNSLIEASTLLGKMSELSISCYDEVLKLLKDNYSLVEKLAEELLDKESLTADAIVSILKG